MANYYQSPSIQFSSFIPEVNPDQYGRALMFQQEKFDNGIRKVQGYIDNVAGLEVIKPQHKEYLNAKMGQIKSQVQGIAASEYSTQKAIGTVASMTNQIVKDPVIQNAVLSTQNYKTQLAFLQKAKQEGKSAYNNEADFMDQYNSWLQDTDINTPFRGTYTPYTDVKKKAIEILKALNPSVKITDDPFTIDENGNTVINDVMIKKSFKGINPDQIRGALLAGMDEKDFSQLSIDGRQSYKGLSAMQLAEIQNPEYRRNITAVDNKIKTKEDQKSTAVSGAEQLALQKEIDALTEEKKRITKDLTDNANLIASGNLTSAKERLYTQQFFNSFSNAFSYTETSESIEKNPWVEVQMERQKIAQKQQENELKSAELYGPVVQAKEALDKPTMAGFNANIQAKQSALDSTKQSFLREQNKLGDDRWYDEQKKLYETGKVNEIDPSVKRYFDNSAYLERDIIQSVQLRNKIEEEANRVGGLNLKDYIPKNAQPVRFKRGDTIYNFTPEEMLEFANKQKINQNNDILNSTAISFAPGGGFGARQNVPKDKMPLTDKERTLARILSGEPKNDIERTIKESYDSYKNIVNTTSQRVSTNRNEFISEQLANRTLETDIATVTLPTEKPELARQTRATVQAFVDRVSDTENQTEGSVRRFDSDTVNKLLKDENSSFSIAFKPSTIYGPSSYKLRISGPNEEYQEISLSEQDMRTTFPQYYGRIEGANVQYPFVNQLAATQNGSTNFEGTRNLSKALVAPYYQQKDFKNVKLFSVKGDVIESDGKFALVTYIYDRKERKDYVRKEIVDPKTGDYLTREQLNVLVSGLSDAKIYKMLYGNNNENDNPSEEQLNEIKSINQIPD